MLVKCARLNVTAISPRTGRKETTIPNTAIKLFAIGACIFPRISTSNGDYPIFWTHVYVNHEKYRSLDKVFEWRFYIYNLVGNLVERANILNFNADLNLVFSLVFSSSYSNFVYTKLFNFSFRGKIRVRFERSETLESNFWKFYFQMYLPSLKQRVDM